MFYFAGEINSSSTFSAFYFTKFLLLKFLLLSYWKSASFGSELPPQRMSHWLGINIHIFSAPHSLHCFDACCPGQQFTRAGEGQLCSWMNFTGSQGFILVCGTAARAGVCEIMLMLATLGSLASKQIWGMTINYQQRVVGRRLVWKLQPPANETHVQAGAQSLLPSQTTQETDF